MKGFMLDEHGDVVIYNNKILMVEGNDLLLQTVKSILGTNKGEWPLNTDEGITFSNILGKNKDENVIKYEVQQGLLQVDDTFIITSFSLDDLGNRKFAIKVSAQNSTGTELGVSTSYGTIKTGDSLITDEEYEQYVPTDSESGYTDSEIRNMITQYGYQTSAQVQSAIKAATSGVYRYKGSVATYADLPTSGMMSGDVYNVESDGMNYAWNGSDWDSLGTIYDVITEAEIDAIINS